MIFTIKPPLYALDQDQTHDLVYCDKLHKNIKSWLDQIKHFPIVSNNSRKYDSGLLLFDRFTPYLYPWCNEYSQKIYDFYSFIGNSYYYQEPWFNGYGISGLNYGELLSNEETYNFNIPNSINITNNSGHWVTIGYLSKNHEESGLYLLHIEPNIDIFSKRFIYIPPNSSYTFATTNILFCSMVLSSRGDITGKVTGIPDELLYDKFEEITEPIKEIILNNFPFLNLCLAQIDYELIATSWHTSRTFLNRAYSPRPFYYSAYIPDSCLFHLCPSWYHYTSLIYANNNKWNDPIIPVEDLGKPIILSIDDDYLRYSIWKQIYDEFDLTSDVKTIPLIGVTESNLTDAPSEVILTYRGYSGPHYALRSPKDANGNYMIDRWYPYDNGGAYLSDIHYALENIDNFFAAGSQSTVAYTEQRWIPEIDNKLFANYSGLCYGFISPFISIEESPEEDFPCTTQPIIRHQSYVRYFFYQCDFDFGTTHLSITMIDSGSININLCEPSMIWPDYIEKIYQDRSYNQANIENESLIMSSYPYVDLIFSPFFFSSKKQAYTITTALQTTESLPLQNINEVDFLLFINTIINEDYQDNDFMPDSVLVKEIHAALQADKYAHQDNNQQFDRIANLGYYIERIARVLAISVDPDGSIRSIRQRHFADSGDTIPAGWPIGQWGRNQGGSDKGQLGGNETEDRDGITYPVISNRFTIDPYTGVPDKVTEGGYVLCENLIQYLETFKDDLDKALGLQYSGANAFPLVQGKGFVAYEGLSVLVQENAYMLSQLSKTISSCQISSLIIQGIVIELMKQQGLPTTIKELKVNIGNGETVFVPYPAFTEDAPSNFDHFLTILMNLSPLLGGKLNIRKDIAKEKREEQE